MKMNDFTIYCTTEQTKKALELGAPIYTTNEHLYRHPHEYKYYVEVNIQGNFYAAKIPTSEQMIGWLRKENNIFFTPKKVGDNNYVLIGDLRHFQTYDSYEESTLAGIDVALEYLKNLKQ